MPLTFREKRPHASDSTLFEEPKRGFLQLLRKRKEMDIDIETYDRWPLQFRRIDLYQGNCRFEERPYPEIVFVVRGSVMHALEGKGGRQLDEGAVVVSHPGSTHEFSVLPGMEEETRLARLRYLPEWLSGDFDFILDSPDLFSLFFAHSWFQSHSETHSFVFTLGEERWHYVQSDLDLIYHEHQMEEPDYGLMRLVLLKMMTLLSVELRDFWRKRNRLELRDEVPKALRAIEKIIINGEPFKLKRLEPEIGMSLDHFGRLFKKATGSTLVDYAQKRRVHHAARLLLTSNATATSIAKRLGFTDAAHFTKSFQRYFGATPQGYRAKFSDVTLQLAAA